MLSGLALGGFVAIVRAPCGDHLLACFVVLQQVQSRIIKIEILPQSSPLLRSEEIKNMIRK